MATNKANTFASMLNEYLTYDLLEQAFKEQSWLWNEANIRKTWRGGKLIVPFQDNYANSVKMGGLTDDSDIGNAGYVRGSVDGYKEVYGSIFFNSRDLNIDHFKVSEQNFISLLPTQIDQLMKFMRQTVSIQLLNGGRLDMVKGAYVGAADGLISVLHPERFNRTMKVVLKDADTTLTGYVQAINRSTGELLIHDVRVGGAPLDLTGLDATTEIFIDGGDTTQFNSLKNDLLLAANGGSDTFANQQKTASTFTQAIQYDAGGSGGTGDWNTGTAIESKDILPLIFDNLRRNYQLGGEADCVLMGYKHFSAAMLALEKGSGGFRHVTDRVDYAGYSKIKVGGVAGSIDLIAIREMDDDWMAMVRKKDMDFNCGNRPFQPLISPDGLKYYTKRAQTGYTYISDIGLYGDFLYRNPWTATGIHNIPDYSIPGTSA